MCTPNTPRTPLTHTSPRPPRPTERHRTTTSEPALALQGVPKMDGATLRGVISSGAPGAPPFDLALAFYDTGVARLRITEADPSRPPRWEVRIARSPVCPAGAAMRVPPLTPPPPSPTVA